MIEPAPWDDHHRKYGLHTAKDPELVDANDLRPPLLSLVDISLLADMPALLTSTSRRFRAWRPPPQPALQPTSDPTSSRRNSAEPPRPRMSQQRVHRRPSLMSRHTTVAPSSASRRACAAPWPLAAPVTSTTFRRTRPSGSFGRADAHAAILQSLADGSRSRRRSARAEDGGIGERAAYDRPRAARRPCRPRRQRVRGRSSASDARARRDLRISTSRHRRAASRRSESTARRGRRLRRPRQRRP